MHTVQVCVSTLANVILTPLLYTAETLTLKSNSRTILFGLKNNLICQISTTDSQSIQYQTKESTFHKFIMQSTLIRNPSENQLDTTRVHRTGMHAS